MRQKGKHYLFSSTLAKYLDEKLKIEKLKSSASAEGRDLSKIDERRIKSNDKKKVKVLDNQVFRSMANLIYLFEFLYEHEELKGLFHRDIEELFGLKGAHTNEMSSPRDWKYRVYSRLLILILYYGINKTDSEIQNGKDLNKVSMIEHAGRNIRLQLVKATARELLRIVYTLSKEKDNILTDIIQQDLKRTQAWVDYCTSGIRLNLDTPHRRINF